MRRRDLLAGGSVVVFASLLGMPPIAAQAQEKYPSRPVRLIVPTPAGGVYDLMGRLFMDRIGPSLGSVVHLPEPALRSAAGGCPAERTS